MIEACHTNRCHQCGGAAVPVAGREYLQCEYCSSLVFLSGNPLSVDRILPGSEELDAACPVCEESLQSGTVEDRPVLYCGHCYGLLIRNDAFGAVVRERRAQRNGLDFATVRPLDPSQYERRIHCPNCREQMEVHPYYGPGNVVIDSCRRCAFVWLDHAELRTIERAQGGAEPAALPLHVNEHGEVTIIPPPSDRQSAPAAEVEVPLLQQIADILFGL